MSRVFLSGVSGYLPGAPLENKDLEALCGVTEEWIDRFVGTRSRYIAFDYDRWEATESLAEMTTKAARSAISSAKTDLRNVEFLVLATATPDQLLPATVNDVADMLGLNGVTTFQLQCGCVGAIQAVSLGYHLVKSGAFSSGLVMGSNACAKFMGPRSDQLPSASEIVHYCLFGDGAGAAMVSSDCLTDSYEILQCDVRFEGGGRAPGEEVRWFGPWGKDDNPDTFFFRERYKEVESHVPRMTDQIVAELRDASNIAGTKIDYYLLPQLSPKMCEHIRSLLEVAKERSVDCIGDTGNSASALPFLQIARLSQLIRANEIALVVAVEATKWLRGAMMLRRC
jgi:3-oxoacyl-[acyl-carrier-protein] synthase-3